ncbi:MAG: hypothetical protein ACTSQ7_06470 [Alphaproteobacteria bacterium]
MQTIKALVIFMGLLILAGLGLLVYGVVGQVSEVSGPGASVGFDAASVALPGGCVLAEARIDEGRLVLRVGGPPSYPQCQLVILLDPDSGAELGRITLVPQP